MVKKLHNAVFLLSKNAFSTTAVNVADSQIQGFLLEFELLFGKESFSPNLLELNHVCQAVQWSGML